MPPCNCFAKMNDKKIEMIEDYVDYFIDDPQVSFDINVMTDYLLQIKYGEKTNVMTRQRNNNYIIASNIWLFLKDNDQYDHSWKMILKFDDKQQLNAIKSLYESNHEYKVIKERISIKLNNVKHDSISTMKNGSKLIKHVYPDEAAKVAAFGVATVICPQSMVLPISFCVCLSTFSATADAFIRMKVNKKVSKVCK